MQKIIAMFLITTCIWNAKAGAIDNGGQQPSLQIIDNVEVPEKFDRIKRDDGDSAGLNIQFQIPDLVTPYKFGTDEVQLEAYRVRNRDEWVSIGQPYFIKDQNNSIYTFSPENVYVQIRVLPDDQKKALQDEAKRRNPSIQSPLINLVPLQSLICSVRFVLGGQEYLLQGKALDLSRLNAIVNMPYPEGDLNRKALLERINKQDVTDPEWVCKFQAAGKELQSNSITITSAQMQDVALEGKLFGKGSEAMVTRNQMNQLTQKVHQRLAIDEQYEIAGDDFDQKLYNKLLDLATAPFQQVPIDQALALISQFGAKYDDRDVSPSDIKKQMSNVLKVEKEGSKSYISLTNDTKREGSESEKHEVGTEVSAKVGVPAIVDVESKVAVKVANERGNTWNNSDLSLDQQLQELNSENTNHVQWEIDGDRIIPKSMNVAKLSKSKMQTDISISYKKTYVQDAQYKKTVVLHTTSFVSSPIVDETNKLKEAVIEVAPKVAKLTERMEKLGEKWNDFVRDTSDQINKLTREVAAKG